MNDFNRVVFKAIKNLQTKITNLNSYNNNNNNKNKINVKFSMIDTVSLAGSLKQQITITITTKTVLITTTITPPTITTTTTITN